MKKISDKKLKKLGGKMPFSSITKKASKPIRKVNPKAKAKRKIAYQKMLRSKEYLAARAEALHRAGYQCEEMGPWIDYGPQLTMRDRCQVTEDLQAHHKSYPKSRRLQASDLIICCKPHHEYLESLKPHKTRMF